MNQLYHFLANLLIFFHLSGAVVATPLPSPTPVITPAPTVYQQPVKPVPVADSPKISKCKLEASSYVDGLTEVFINSSASSLLNTYEYKERALLFEAKTQPLSSYELRQITSSYDMSIAEKRDPAQLDALIRIVSDQIINSQKELQTNFNKLSSQQYNLKYLECVNR